MCYFIVTDIKIEFHLLRVSRNVRKWGLTAKECFIIYFQHVTEIVTKMINMQKGYVNSTVLQ